VYHHNIRGLKDKVQEFTTSLFWDFSHILCLTGLHLKEDKIDMASIANYKLGAKFCRWVLKNGGVCIFMYDPLNSWILIYIRAVKNRTLRYVLLN
jgi:hypothetical protein